MKCKSHNELDATAICINCGVALCENCSNQTNSGKIVCSDLCEQYIANSEMTINIIQDKMLKQNKTAGLIYYLLGILFLLFSPFPYFDGIWQLTIFFVVFGLAFIVGGWWARKVGKEISIDKN